MIAYVILYALHVLPPPPNNEPRFETRNTEGMKWWKGNTHTHTTMSDGDSSPEVVAQWYKRNGYQFLVLSDHNIFTNPTIIPISVGPSTITRC